MVTGFKGAVQIVAEAMAEQDRGLLNSYCASWLAGKECALQRTPIGVAISFDSMSSLQVLLRCGADTNLICEHNNESTAWIPTPVALAVHTDNPAMLEVLLNAGAQRDATFTYDFKKFTPMQLAKEMGRSNCERVLSGVAAEVAIADEKDEQRRLAAVTVEDVISYFREELCCSEKSVVMLKKERVDGVRLHRIHRDDLHDLLLLPWEIIEQYEAGTWLADKIGKIE